VSARAALLASLQEGDLVVLPLRRHSVMVHGLSGSLYKGWAELPAQQVRIRQLVFVDMATAEVVLDDGRG
jgi:hypothetical protein